jgi:hypothetical protein
MEEEIRHAAEAYMKIKANARAYYHANADAISQKRKEKYHEKNPDAGVRPNRKRKGQVVPV